MKRKSEKNTTILPGDLALVHVENKPAFFARVEGIDPDHKRNWWRVRLLVLNLPLKIVTWILDNDQIRGAEFAMGGVPVRLEKIIAPKEEPAKIDLQPQVRSAKRQSTEKGKPARILAFKRRQEIKDEGDV